MPMKAIGLFIAAVVLALLASCSPSGQKNADNASEQQEAVTEVGSAVRVLGEGETFDVNVNPERLTIIDFNATWCGPCRAFAPTFEAASVKYKGEVDFISVDVDVHKDMAASLNINSIPAILFIRQDGTKEWNIGLMDADEFDGKIREALNK